MNRHVTRFTAAAQRQMRRIPRSEAVRILHRLAELQNALDEGDTGAFDIKPLSGHQGRWRLRVGDYRVVYAIDKDDDGQPIIWVWVLGVGDRRDIYDRNR
ncbi:type II toxin-antitoxin system RelE family toxin [Nocardiopsis changdeensis]|uniref:Type II toxin-antitoxin system RelE/ParE family toxin n=2 Tax=Nocardiopsis TaxID=2013 RepID=A0ABX8BSB8_9ACTN|nr:type II toxin-antitoxin system RelE/ParE family toxin [Nocardiopsis changdeensis]QUX23273.1 type II toxin-antitoxin system RelE/ParE family toxin [Nocardiopsis changdeensis]QYX39215.1 type II toxin-antitoxin system RelE/ParE family toxin [Nocardiopsis sp. MT53]